MVPGIWGGYIAMWVWFGPRIRAESSENRWVTPTEFLTATLDDRSGLRIAALATGFSFIQSIRQVHGRARVIFGFNKAYIRSTARLASENVRATSMVPPTTAFKSSVRNAVAK